LYLYNHAMRMNNIYYAYFQDVVDNLMIISCLASCLIALVITGGTRDRG
jgi:hypothetical protein